ncbi:MAG: capsule assembly Wzi family protein [Bacteroidota bacterium]
MKAYYKCILLTGKLFLLLGWHAATCQTVFVGQPGLEDALRSLQLQGKIDRNISFTARPFFYGDSLTVKELHKLIDGNDSYSSPVHFFAGNKGKLEILPVITGIKFNSHHPYGWNDAGMLSAKGIQASVSAGVHASLGPLSIQLQPEYVYSANTNFEYNAAYGAPTEGAFNRLYGGQSSIRLNVSGLSLGISTENMWWGPGMYSSLLMSNNAPGFVHFTFNTVKPIKTFIGSFEWELVAGRLDEDTSRLFENFHMKPAGVSNNDPRYINGIVLTYQPKWVPGLFLGVTRMFQMYEKDLDLQGQSFFGKYIPVLSDLFISNENIETSKKRDQILSLFTRWLFPKSNAEIYFEFGYNDHPSNMRDLINNPEHSAAYIAGIKKMVSLEKNKWLDFTAEITQMAQTSDYLVRDGGNWYVHSQVHQGYTNQNQILGAGSGLGNNVQTITGSFLTGWNKLGLRFQRIQHDPRATVEPAVPSLGLRKNKWNDIAIGLFGQVRSNKFIINADIQFVNSKNYAWANENRFNLYGLLNFIYLW